MAVTAALVESLLRVVGPGGVSTSEESRLAYECDALVSVKGKPDLIVFPRSSDEVAPVVMILANAGVPVVPRAAGTGLAGGATAVDGGALLVLNKLTRILDISLNDGYAVVESGVVNIKLTRATEADGYCFAPDPASQVACTIGGNVACNSGGPHTLKYGVTTNHVLGVEMVMSDGGTVWLGGVCEDAPGYDLRGLVVGSEGTLGIVTKVAVKLTRIAPALRTMFFAFRDVESGSAAVSAVISAGIVPAAMEIMDQVIVCAVEDAFNMGLPRNAGAVLIVELDGLPEGLDRQAGMVVELCRDKGAFEVRVARTEKERLALWGGRKKAGAAVGRVARNYISQDLVVPRTRLKEMVAGIRQIGVKHGLSIGQFGHAGDGNVHPLTFFDERNRDEVAKLHGALHEIFELAISMGGTVTGEHGVGVEKVKYLAEQFGPAEMAIMRRIRKLFDPALLLNPGKVMKMNGGGPDPAAGKGGVQ